MSERPSAAIRGRRSLPHRSFCAAGALRRKKSAHPHAAEGALYFFSQEFISLIRRRRRLSVTGVMLRKEAICRLLTSSAISP